MKTVETIPASGSKVGSVHKFGRNEDVDAAEYINPLGLVPKQFAVGAASAMYISSSHAGDTDVYITIEYIDDAGNPQIVTTALDGADSTTFVDTGVTAIFVNRAYVSSGAITLNGDVYISSDNTDVGGDGIPDTLSDTFSMIPLAENQTMQAQFLIPLGFVGEVSGWKATVVHDSGAATSVTFRIKQLPSGGSWRTVESDGARSTGTTKVGTIWPDSEDFPALTMIALDIQEVSLGDVDVTGSFYMRLVAT